MILLLKIDKCMFPKVAQELQKENDPLTLFSIVIWEYPSPFPTGLLCFSGDVFVKKTEIQIGLWNSLKGK